MSSWRPKSAASRESSIRGTLDYAISAYLWAREYDKAMTLADHLISLYPDSRTPHFYRTGMLDLMGKHEEALEEAKKLIDKGEDENHSYLVKRLMNRRSPGCLC